VFKNQNDAIKDLCFEAGASLGLVIHFEKNVKQFLGKNAESSKSVGLPEFFLNQ